MITTTGLNVFGNAIVGALDHGAVITNGATEIVSIYKTEVVGNEVRIYLLFDGNYSGTMTSFKLRDKTSQVLVEQADNIDKIYNKLLLVTFKITLTERVVTA